ncbi:MAG: hypothetical protein GF364_18560 [Candidatus Lokiarchaeota archaeon]|nr:hypothetical protein [Candidatus Lokiarchaeota archaeon]
MTKHIGKIIKSESHVIYWAQVENNLEGDPAPDPRDCAFGTFVKIDPVESENLLLVGLIYDTILIDRDALRAGPRLSPDIQSTKLLFPDFIDEKMKLVKVLLIGYLDKDKRPHHSFPNVAPNLNDSVIKMEEDEIKRFHIIDGEYKMGYYSAGISLVPPLIKPLFLRILTKLIKIFPAHKKPILILLRNNLEFKMKMERGF